ncbi:MAG: amidase [Candidatus Kaiserbacteria bacterium]|nr:amidase [Candidatus Kaiserbacteria bacterium]
MNRIFLDHPIGELVAKIQAQELSPDDLMRAAIDNIAEMDGQFHAWTAYRDTGWQARTTPMDGYAVPEKLLDGIPVGVKDIYNTVDFATEMGSPIWKGFTPGNDARAVYHLKRQGAQVAGKTVTAEFAVHALDKTLNPWDVTKTPGTSSSGSAVAIALGQVPLATGSQTAGSIVRPASFCGVYGMKPSFGTIPRTGTLKTTDSLDTLGFFTIHEADLRRGFDAVRIRGLDYPISNSALADESRQKKPTDRPWRVALAKAHTWQYASDYAQKALEGFAEKLTKNGIEITEAQLPSALERSHEIHETIYNKALSYYFKGEYKQSDFVSPIMNELIAKGNMISSEIYKQVLQDQLDLIRAMDTFFADCDVLISLSTAGEAPPREITESPDPSLIWTLAHLPVVSVPQFSSPAKLPFGFQAAARKYNDYLLLDFLDELREKGMIPSRGGLYE